MSLVSVEISGSLLSEYLLDSLSIEDSKHKFVAPESFRWERYDVVDSKAMHLSRIAEAYENLKARWDLLSPEFEKLDLSELREKWLKHFFSQFGYNLQFQKADVVADSGNKFCLSHRGWDGLSAPIIHTVSFVQDLDHKPNDGRHKYSPHDTLQRYLNQSHTDNWGVVTNGKELRILRDFHHETRKAYVKFDIEAIFDGRDFSDFRLLWRLIHPSRFIPKDDNKPILEVLFEESKDAGIAIGDDLRRNIRFAIETLANGFLLGTPELAEKATDNHDVCSVFHQQILRVIYRILFLLYVEQRRLMPGKSSIYAQEYSISALREKLENRQYYDAHRVDIWEGLKSTFLMVYKGVSELGIPPFNGQLFDPDMINMLGNAYCRNDRLMESIKYMSLFEKEGVMQRISYIELGVDEIGSIYESLLAFIPRISSKEETFEDEDIRGKDKRRVVSPRTFFLDPRGTNRKTSGSYYTNPGLVNALIESALIPVLEEKLKLAGPHKDAQEQALLALKVCDPACGSAAFLIAATEYLGARLAKIRIQDDYPSDEQIRHARRDVLRHCIYGVDINPMAVELAKVSLWLTAATGDQPLNFLDHRIKCGNSLIGATPELIGKGISPEAYTAVEGDNANITKERSKQAKAYYKTKDKEKGQIHLNVVTLAPDSKLIYCEDLSLKFNENSPDEIDRIERAYTAYREESLFLRNKFIADYWTSAFFWPHIDEKVEYPRPEVLEYLLSNEKANLFGEIRTKIQNLAQGYKFFHWHLEFPEVFSQGGFDCVLGNPPFLGGLKISEMLGEQFRKWLDINFPEAKGRTDLCAYFYRKVFLSLKQNGMIGMVATNTIGQGETQEGGLAVIVADGGIITFAQRFVKWTGDATVEVNLIGIRKGLWDQPLILDEKEVDYISSRLDTDSEKMPKPLTDNKSKAFQGSIVLGMGFVLESVEAERLIKKDPRNKECLFPFINGDDINSRVDHSPSRWVIQFGEKDIDEAKSYPDLWKIVEERVLPERKKCDGKKYPRMVNEWWKHWNNRKELYELASKLSRVLIRSRVSELHMLVFVPNNIIYSDATVIFTIDDYFNFGLLQSNIHEVWLRKFASTLRTDVRYTPRDCFETFPFPQAVAEEKQSQLIKTAEKYYLHRNTILNTRKIGLTQTYNLFHDSSCSDDDIKILRNLHADLDVSASICYGWDNIQLGHNFIQNDRGKTRYSITTSAKKAILDRLLDLNLSI